MPKYKVSFSVVGSTHTIIESANADDARECFIDNVAGAGTHDPWVAADQNWEAYEIDSIEMVEDAEPPKTILEGC
jgi:hypothetical protein